MYQLVKRAGKCLTVTLALLGAKGAAFAQHHGGGGMHMGGGGGQGNGFATPNNFGGVAIPASPETFSGFNGIGGGWVGGGQTHGQNSYGYGNGYGYGGGIGYGANRLGGGSSVGMMNYGNFPSTGMTPFDVMEQHAYNDIMRAEQIREMELRAQQIEVETRLAEEKLREMESKRLRERSGGQSDKAGRDLYAEAGEESTKGKGRRGSARPKPRPSNSQPVVRAASAKREPGAALSTLRDHLSMTGLKWPHYSDLSRNEIDLRTEATRAVTWAAATVEFNKPGQAEAFQTAKESLTALKRSVLTNHSTTRDQAAPMLAFIDSLQKALKAGQGTPSVALNVR